MARAGNLVSLVVFMAAVVLSCSLFSHVGARPLLGFEHQSAGNAAMAKIIDELRVAAMKPEGQSSRGDGHSSTDDLIALGGIKNSGPSPGANH